MRTTSSRCHALIRIPVAAEYGSLNLAQAVQIVCYEILMATQQPGVPAAARLAAIATAKRCWRSGAPRPGAAIVEIHARGKCRTTRRPAQRLFARALPDDGEVRILRGMLAAIERGSGLRSESVDGWPDLSGSRGDDATRPRVAAVMSECLSDPSLQANPASAHAPGRAASARIDLARLQVAQLINAPPESIVFTSGATSVNLAVLGVARAAAPRGRHVITSRIEHRARSGRLPATLEREPTSAG